MKKLEEYKRRFKQWWRITPPKTKRTIILSTALLIFGTMLFVSSLFTTHKRKPKKVLPPQVEIISRKEKSQLYESAAVRRLRQKVGGLEDEIQNLKKDMQGLKKMISDMHDQMLSSQQDIKEFQAKLIENAGRLKEILAKAKKKKTEEKKEEKKEEKPFSSFTDMWSRTPASVSQPVPPPPQKSKQWQKKGKMPLSGKSVPLVSEIKAEQPEKPEEQKEEVTIRIPSGSFFRGILLNGVDAPVAVSFSIKKNPYPVLIKVKTEAWLPNEYRYDIKGCYIVAAAWGDMSSERVYFRTERFSCVRRDGGVIETQLDASIIDGQDGKLGVFGKLVSKQGQLIARSLVAGLATGFSEALSPRQGMIYYHTNSSEDYYMTPPLGETMKYGFLTGLGQAANKVADFYLKMAEQVFPVVEIQAGTPVEIFLLRGLTLTIKKVGSKEFVKG